MLMDKSTNSYIDLDPAALSQVCGERIGQLRAKAWSTQAEREQLREDTVLLLDAVAQQLSVAGNSCDPMDAATLREIMNNIEHGPLSARSAQRR